MTAASWYASTDEYAPRTGGVDDASGAQKEADSVNLDTSRHRLAPGTRVGDHLIVRGVLGEGGTAVVYEALHTRLGASVALKVVDIAEEYMEGARARLLREAHVCASLEDSHIPRVYDVGELPDGTPYVVMERVSGRTLESVLSKGPLPLDVAVRITDDLLLAVEAIENAGIVHRDIKPPNIILQSGGDGTLRVRLMDFGVSKNVNAGGSQPGMMASNPSLTQQGAIVGTPHYMAPEQIVGPTVDSRADLYAVGVVAYEMMGGRTPFEGQTTGEVVAAVLHTRPLPLGKLCEVCEELEAWVDKAMAPQRTDRFANARVMRDALQAAWLRQKGHVAESGRRGRANKVRVGGALALLALAFAVPLPAGYDLHALTKFLRPDPSDPARASAPASGAAAAAPVAAGGVAAGTEPRTEQLAAPPAAAPVPSWDMQGGDPAQAAGADNLDEATLPQSERVREKAEGEAPVEDAVNQGDDAAAKAAAPTPGSAAPAAPAVEAGRPLKRARGETREVAPRAVPASPDAPPPREAAPQQGILLEEYLRQLDNKIKAPPADRDDEPREREREREPARTPGQPAPNPFDAIPDNPYQQ
ncbi:MAG: serine/threonine-protein kinase [Polyangiales bacterium]